MNVGHLLATQYFDRVRTMGKNLSLPALWMERNDVLDWASHDCERSYASNAFSLPDAWYECVKMKLLSCGVRANLPVRSQYG
jgi:hypothetical protein